MISTIFHLSRRPFEQNTQKRKLTGVPAAVLVVTAGGHAVVIVIVIVIVLVVAAAVFVCQTRADRLRYPLPAGLREVGSPRVICSKSDKNASIPSPIPRTAKKKKKNTSGRGEKKECTTTRQSEALGRVCVYVARTPGAMPSSFHIRSTSILSCTTRPALPRSVTSNVYLVREEKNPGGGGATAPGGGTRSARKPLSPWLCVVLSSRA